MKKRFSKFIIFILFLIVGVVIGIFLRQNKTSWLFIEKHFPDKYVNSNYLQQNEWGKDFKIVEIKSSIDNHIQKSYSYRSKSSEPKPLIVSLHTWSGDYAQKDAISQLCKNKDLNYMHPNFRGANNTINACCSDLVISDIDDTIAYAINNFNVDTTKIFIIGFSGGGYATLCAFMKSKYTIKKFSAWASITDLNAWYNESKARNNNYVNNILDCTGKDSINGLNIAIAKKKSPIYWDIPTDQIENRKLSIYAGIYDGIQGSVPITHSINFYNKLLKDLSVYDTLQYVTDSEKLNLLENRRSLGNFGYIAGREIILEKEYKNLSLKIFEGNHEILTEFALNDLLGK